MLSSIAATPARGRKSTVPERHRRAAAGGDEPLHTSAAAFDRGDAARLGPSSPRPSSAARTPMEALVLLERINRFEPTRVRPARSAPTPRAGTPTRTAGRQGPPRVPPGLPRGCWPGSRRQGRGVDCSDPARLDSADAGGRAPRTVVADEPLPVPSPAEAWVARARGLYEDGRLRDALGVLDAVSDQTRCGVSPTSCAR